MDEVIIIILITIFGVPIGIVISVVLAMRDMDKQQKEMLRENERYYQKMKNLNK